LIWTRFTDFRQLEQQRLDAENNRFQQAYSRLGSQLPSERSRGVAQLSTLMGTNNSKRDREVLIAMVNELALDDSPEIRNSILNVFQNLKGKADKSALDAALQSAAISKESIFDLVISSLSSSLR
jgi:hypothetical protein